MANYEIMLKTILTWYKENQTLLQFISLFISGIFLALIVYFNLILNLTGEKIEFWIDVIGSKNITRKRSLRAWKQIQKRLKAGDANNLKLAVLEADRILDEILNLAGYPGDNLNEWLENTTVAQIPNIEELRQVHKVRDRLVAEPDFTLTLGEAEIAINIYKKTFVDLGLIRED